ncbi:MAG TPA: hypothetical protein VLE49_05075 [Anaerolineales bacterium]|nr:hypothetical protein [Anaerolineales bacterium]
MIDDIRDIAASYNSDPQREHSRLERHQLEYDLTWRYLDQPLPVQGSILGASRHLLYIGRKKC